MRAQLSKEIKCKIPDEFLSDQEPYDAELADKEQVASATAEVIPRAANVAGIWNVKKEESASP